MFTAADLHDPSAVVAFRAEAAARAACQPALDWLAYVARQGRTLAEALAEAELTQEGRGWCAWCREHLEAVMDAEVRRAFLAASLVGATPGARRNPEEQRAVTWSSEGRLELSAAERWLCLAAWHSAGREGPRRRQAERREALGW